MQKSSHCTCFQYISLFSEVIQFYDKYLYKKQCAGIISSSLTGNRRLTWWVKCFKDMLDVFQISHICCMHRCSLHCCLLHHSSCSSLSIQPTTDMDAKRRVSRRGRRSPQLIISVSGFPSSPYNVTRTPITMHGNEILYRQWPTNQSLHAQKCQTCKRQEAACCLTYINSLVVFLFGTKFPICVSACHHTSVRKTTVGGKGVSL